MRPESSADALLSAFLEHRWQSVAEMLTSSLRSKLSVEQLADGWVQLEQQYGDATDLGETSSRRVGPHLVVDCRVAFGKEEFIVRAAFITPQEVDGLFLLPVEPDEGAVLVGAKRAMRLGTAVIALPLVACAVIARVVGEWFPGAFGLGSAGWLLALSLRLPLLKSRGEEGRKRAGAVISGPFEEFVRLGAVLVAVGSAREAVQLGTGWAAAEAFSVGVNLIGLAVLANRATTAAPAKQRLAQFSSQSQSFILSLSERFIASTFHIAAALLVYELPLGAPLLAVLHSGLNLSAIRAKSTFQGQFRAAVIALLACATAYIAWVN